MMDAFERDYGCTEQEWRRWMPVALQGQAWADRGPAALRAQVGAGTLDIAWEVLAPRVIAQVRLPRMRVSFRFDGVDPEARARFMRHFDLHLQRGGG